MSVTVFLSTVSDEFRPYCDQLRADLTLHDVAVKVQEDFKDPGGDTLDKLDVYISHCDAVVHLVGDMTGAIPGEREQAALLAKYPDIGEKLPPLGEALKSGATISYTHWEAWLALYHGKLLLIAKAADDAKRAPKYEPTADSRVAQLKHLSRLEAMRRYPSFTFTSPADLAKQIVYTAILDLLVKDYAEAAARERDIAESFIHEVASRVAGDRTLDFEGKKQAVRNAIEFYEKEIPDRLMQTNFRDIVDAALAKAKAHVDNGQYALARATLRMAAKELKGEREGRRAAYVEAVTTLYNHARDISLAADEGDAAAEAVIARIESVYGADRARIFKALTAETKALYEHGREKRSNVHLVAAVALSRKLQEVASMQDERGAAYDWLGIALRTLGERERGTARLEEAVTAFREALTEHVRERVPLDWAMTQNNIGLALGTLGERESGTARLEEAVAAYRAALEERTRERVPREWQLTQNNLLATLRLLEERKKGSVSLPQPLANIPSPFTFGWNSAGKISVIAGPQNQPYFPFARSEKDHAQWLATCRKQVERLLEDLAERKNNIRSEYVQALKRYLEDLPSHPGEGNFMLADGEARILRQMFGADAEILPPPFAARLRQFLETNMALRPFYQEAGRFRRAVQEAVIEEPLPLDAFEGLKHEVGRRPDVFEPEISAGLEKAEREPPSVEAALKEAPQEDSGVIRPPPEPEGEVDAHKARAVSMASSGNSLWQTMLKGGDLAKGIDGWDHLFHKVGEYAGQLIEWLANNSG